MRAVVVIVDVPSPRAVRASRHLAAQARATRLTPHTTPHLTYTQEYTIQTLSKRPLYSLSVDTQLKLNNLDTFYANMY